MVTPAKKLTQAKVAMQFDHPFFGYLAITLDCVEDPTLNPPTMGTDGTHLFYHPDFVTNTALPQLCGVVAHEIGHIILHHLSRRQNREALRWNISADFAVNYIVRQEFQLPPGCLISHDYANKPAEFIYNELPITKVQVGLTLDSHEKWGNWGKDEGDGKDDDKGADGNGNGIGRGDSQDDLEQEWRQRVAQAATQAHMKGKMPAHLESIVGELLQPKLDWKTMLRDMVTSCAKSTHRFLPPNKKHLYRGFYLPSVSGDEIKIATCIDSSGSISDEEIKEFLSEIKGICDSYDEYTVHILVADAIVHQRFEVHAMEDMPTIVKGRGGTSFVPALAEAEKLEGITAIVYFTDLDGTFPTHEPTVPVIWVSVDPNTKAPWGFTIKYPRTKN